MRDSYSTEEKKRRRQGRVIVERERERERERVREREREMLLKNEVTESFLRAGRVARQFSNV